LNLAQEVVNQREWIAVLLGDGVERSVVDTKAEAAVLLLDKDDWGCGRRRGGSDEPLRQVVL
jgi:hypothetical protein